MSRLTIFLLAWLPGFSLAHAQAPDPGADSISEIQRMMTVEVRTAALRTQSLQDAPASVTVITADDIRRYGYRTIGEALSNVRGFYMVSDGAFRFAGVRGFSLLGDYNTRFLVLLNGHHLTDNVYSSMYYFGQDFPLDMDMVAQIEIVRGPSSALYGSNGLFSTVNVITKTPATAENARVSVETGSFASRKVVVSSSFQLGRETKVLLAASGFHAGGRTVNYPGLAREGIPPERVRHAEAELGYHTFANVVWKNWTLTALFGASRAIAPTGLYSTDLGDTATRDLESRDFVEAAWNRPLGRNGEMRWRTYYDRFRYDGIFVFARSFGYRNYDGALGDWIGSQFVYQTRSKHLGIVSLGAEGNVDLRNVQYDFDVLTGEAGRVVKDGFRISHRRSSGAVLVQDEVRLAPGWTAFLGGRLDGSTSDRAFFSPRAALVYTTRHGSYKLIYGSAFRNPSTYERYWAPSPELRQERVRTLELVTERRLQRRINMVASVFRYNLADLIQGVPAAGGILRYQSVWRASAMGVEAEVNAQPRDWLDTAASVSLQRVRGRGGQQRLPNSPARLAQFKAAVPAWRNRLVVSGAARFVGSRLSAYRETVPAVVLADMTLTARRLHPRLDFQFGVRNLLNRYYEDPLSSEHTPHLLPGAARNVFLKLIWHSE